MVCIDGEPSFRIRSTCDLTTVCNRVLELFPGGFMYVNANHDSHVGVCVWCGVCPVLCLGNEAFDKNVFMLYWVLTGSLW